MMPSNGLAYTSAKGRLFLGREWGPVCSKNYNQRLGFSLKTGKLISVLRIISYRTSTTFSWYYKHGHRTSHIRPVLAAPEAYYGCEWFLFETKEFSLKYGLHSTFLVCITDVHHSCNLADWLSSLRSGYGCTHTLPSLLFLL
jgi:hypothetical protein